MDKQTQMYVDGFMADLVRKNPGESEFHQAVKEVVESVAPMIMAYPYLREQKVMERIVEPERVIRFSFHCRVLSKFGEAKVTKIIANYGIISLQKCANDPLRTFANHFSW